MVREEILDEIRAAGVYGLMTDTTPDRNHVEQMTIIIRYAKVEFDSEVTVSEREAFLDFIPLEGPRKSAELMHALLVKKLTDDGLDLKRCVAQSYDNAAVMAGEFCGVQARMMQDAPCAVFINCTNHSLNLCCVAAAQIDPSVVTFFGILEKTYVFFSGSTIRWEVLRKVNVAVKRSLPQRWSARHDAVQVFSKKFAEIVCALDCLSEDPYNNDTKALLIQKKCAHLRIPELSQVLGTGSLAHRQLPENSRRSGDECSSSLQCALQLG